MGEFRKYLDKTGVLDLLTKSLVQLYEESEKPSDAVTYLKNTVGGVEDDKTAIEKLKNENAELKTKVADLESNQTSLQKRISELECSAGSGITEAVSAPMEVTSMETPVTVAGTPEVGVVQEPADAE